MIRKSIYLCSYLFLLFCIGIFTFATIFLSPTVQAQSYFKSTTGTVSFLSDAPLEDIKAQSGGLNVVINPLNRTFAFSVPVKSFQGFNSALQRQHFNENYLESGKYPYGVFKGKIIEDVNLTKNGTYNIRAKGSLQIHGVSQERIINATVVVNNNTIAIRSVFDLTLLDHNIKIPKIVFQKIAEVIKVTVNATATQ